ncbi:MULTISPECIES: aspartyl/asparaginyl beta-hydroxylase domain-containing protein [Xanthomonas]|uniref:Aspartyl/asparaginyl beta-hydroxylase domain-containing protein n=1 Tax=Xanthomonas hortorum pv. hederae TaxID=453603 RepID=A0A9X4BVP6_9XANT|nr:MULTISPECIES: aspartyl/asparaginyl beta-hydroxylase domain-containing protein [Xanthomonas]MDC8640432.1 aspartyl/asparaginyl beta-hydroxylase domain-containing protein [Xanthomonas hortorum pv. hederae]SOU07477.1 aspartyl-asparaginyl beta-hydroxylase [Xanthomonas arboricola pv. fragariae]
MATTNDTVGIQIAASPATGLQSLVDAIRASADGRCAFFDPDGFAWVEELEAEYPVIRAELERVLDAVELLPGLEDVQVGQYSLTKDRRWKVLPLYAYGRWSERNARRCPATARALQRVPGLQVAMFSIMQSGKELPPHYGNYCGVLRYHLGLVVPDPPEACGLQVGDEVRHWRNGASLIFDDSHLHAAWNRSDRDRGILLLDFVRPLPPELTRRNDEVVAAIAASPSIEDSANRWNAWESAFGAQLDRLLGIAD